MSESSERKGMRIGQGAAERRAACTQSGRVGALTLARARRQTSPTTSVSYRHDRPLRSSAQRVP